MKERIEDVPLLVDYFIDRFKNKRRKTVEGAEYKVLQLLQKYNYPGNIRELENAIEHAFVMCNEGMIKVEHLPQKIVKAVKYSKETLPDGRQTGQSEKAIILEALQRNNGNKSRSAKELGIDRTTLWRKLKRFNIQL